MTGLPRKYAKMGFKKGWREYKKTKSSPTPINKSNSRRRTIKTTRRAKTMVKRKRTYKRKSGINTLFKPIIYGGAYGMAREPLNQFASGFLGGMSDEIGMGLISSIAFLKGKGMVKELGKAGLYVEAHNLGRNMSGGIMNIFNVGNNATATSTSVGYPI